MTKEAEWALIDRIIAGEREAYATLVDRYKGYAVTLALKILGDRADAEEAAQDAFVKAFHHLNDFNKQAKFSTWLYRIVFNTSVSYKRRRRIKFDDIEKTSLGLHTEADHSLEKHDRQKYLRQAMNILAESDRAALTLFYLDELSLDEIAVVTGQPPNTMKVRIHRARIRLAEALKTILKKEALTL
ncbi:MAG: sigma-70 family RNA polymerase sigma factor [Bacteroidia bacterium]|nr:sigma-70 family RNA polymerase sigma factor [Bacteroidia bacterium]